MEPWNSMVVLLAGTIVLLAAAAAAAEEIGMEQAPPGIAWAVQLSDLHLSVFHPNRASDLESLASQALALVRPGIVIITGDLTDAKNRELTVTRQDEAEWKQYRRAIEVIVQKTGLPLRAFFDLRGNHDKFGVPYVKSDLDFFSRYSVTASLNRTLVQSVILKTNDDWRYQFVGFDDSMDIGLRGPSNIFGHPTDKLLDSLDTELSKLNEHVSTGRVSKVVFGHFPMSFTTSSESGRRPEEVFAKQGVSAYVCGHLHMKFGKQLYRLHSRINEARTGMNEFWEWEMGDWRGYRMMRIIAIDHGHVSFVDFSLKGFSNLTTIVLPTYPLDSRFTKKHPATVGFDNDPVGDSMRAIVFSTLPPSRVVASIYDKKTGSPVVADEIEMQPVSGNAAGNGRVYRAAWRRNRYSDPSPLRYWVQVSVMDPFGRQVSSELRPFSVDGKVAVHLLGFWGYSVMGVHWADAYPVLFWLNIALLSCMLLLPKLYLWHLEKSKSYTSFVVSILDKTWRVEQFVKFPVWVLVEGCRNSGLWWSQVLFVGYLLVFPWFWGIPTAEGYPTGYMTYRGWQIYGEASKLGTADVFSVVLPFCYLVLLPLVAVMALMSAERAATEFRTAATSNQQKKEESTMDARKRSLVDSGLRQLLEQIPVQQQQQPINSKQHQHQQHQHQNQQRPRSWGNWMRKSLLFACVLIGWLHWRQCHRIASAYGPKAVLASPGFAWPPPLFIAFAVYETRSLQRSRF